MRIPTQPRLTFLFIFIASLLFGTPLHAQQNWRWLNSLPASIAWKDAAYGNGLYVIVGADGTIASSPDAVQWTLRRSSTSGFVFNGVAFGGGRFVAVGMGSPSKAGAGLIATSTDGINWTLNEEVAANYSAQLADVAWGNGLWVVSGASQNRILTSTDGLVWTALNVGATTGSLAFSDGRFVMLTNNNRALISTDGIAWTQVTLDPVANAFYGALTVGGGRFVALGRDSSFKSRSATSTDGTTWTVGAGVADSDGGAHSIGYAGSVFVFGGNTELYSGTDGLTWTKQTSAMPTARRSTPNSSGPENINAVAGANGTLFVLGAYGSITTSTDGAAWTRRSTGTVHDINGLVYDGTRFVGVGTGGTVVTSPDGVTWTASSTNFTGWFGKLAYADGRYVAASMAGLRQSTDLATWTSVPEASNNQMWGVIHANGRFIAASNGISPGLLVSPDGTTWTTVKIAGASGSVLGLAGGNGSYVLILGGFGVSPKIFSSTDASTWTDTTPASFTVIPGSVAYANQRFVILAGTAAWSSPDGINWTSTETAFDLPLNAVMGLEDRFVARSNAAFAGSTDGIAWSLIEDSLAPGMVIGAMVKKDGYIFMSGGAGALLQGDLAGDGGSSPQYPAAGSSTTLTTTATGTIQWEHNGSTVSGGTAATLALDNLQPASTGVYTAAATDGGVTTRQSFIVGVTTTSKVIGAGTELGTNIVHPNGNVFDQVLLTGPAEAITADHAQNQITRTSYIDLDGDIVQVEFSGPGTLSLVLDSPTDPAPPANYNQAVNYMKGHAGIVITGATEHTNVSVFSVGKATAVDQALFKDSVTYDGIADIAFIAISSSNGNFGGVRTANAHYFAAKGLTGLYAPGVAFQGPVYLGDITASSTATPVLIIGSASDTRITGGNLDQDNDAAVEVAGLTQLKFTAGSDSHGNELLAQTNAGVLKANGVDVTAQVVVNP